MEPVISSMLSNVKMKTTKYVNGDFMKNFIFTLLILVGVSCTTNAAQGSNVAQTLISTNTCNGFSVSNIAGSEVTQGELSRYILVQNEHATANLYCKDASTVATSGSARGFKIIAGQTIAWTLVPGQPWYCISDGATSTNAMICRGY